MTLSPDERRDLRQIGRILSRDKELFAVTNLFAQPLVPPWLAHLRAEEHQTTRRGRHLGAAAAVLAAAVLLLAGCLVGSTDRPGPIAAGVVLVLCSAAVLVAVLVRYRRQVEPGSTDG